MNHPTEAPDRGSNKRLWAALLVVVMLLLAMGATLIRIQSRPIEPRAVVLPKLVQAPVAPVAPATLREIKKVTNMPAALSEQAQAATEYVASQGIQITEQPRPVSPRTSEPAVARPPPTGTSAASSPATQ